MQLSFQAAELARRLDRREFLTASAATSLGSSVLANQKISTDSRGHRIVKVILQGGPSQIDLWDPKPNATAEIRGDYQTISTNIAGIQVSECLPRIAMMMDQFTIVRSITGSMGSHDLIQAETGATGRTGPQPRKNQNTKYAPNACHPSATTSSSAKTFSHAQTLLQTGHTDIVLRFGNWDHHHKLKPAIQPIARQLDQQLTVFIRSLARTEFLDKTTVLVWGEFGRSPRINATGGRDHWPAVNSALIAGGPSARGNVWGATSDDGSHIVDSPISMSSLIQQCGQSTATCLA